MVTREATGVVKKTFGRQAESALPGMQNIELILASAGVGDIAQMLDGSTDDHRHLGALGARLIELGHSDISDDDQTYADAMHALKHRLDQDPSSRQALAMNARTYGRPPGQLITEADDWVAPMVEDEIKALSDNDHDVLSRRIIMRVGQQHDIHASFRPLLLRLATDHRTLTCLASADQGHADGHSGSRSYLMAAIAAPFVDVVMNDADDGIELEAAAWNLVQKRLLMKSAKASTQDLIRSAGAASSLLALIDTSRSLAARQSQAQAHAGRATRTAVAEFILSNLVLLSTNPNAIRTVGRLSIGSFVRRDDVGRSPVDIPETELQNWAARRSSRRLLLDLFLITLLADSHRHDVPPIPPFSDQGIADQARRHLAAVEQQTIGKMAIHAIDGGWHLNDWAGAA